MPEVITKHPEVVKEVLQSAGARCGAGAPQKILTKCPPEQFCALPGGEICVYPVSDIGSMTQLSRAELCQTRTEASPRGAPSSGAELAFVGLVPGLALGAVLALARYSARSGSGARCDAFAAMPSDQKTSRTGSSPSARTQSHR